ncbi:MAG: DUF7594 domain-containing protein [Verrucomicrobiales bacterium]
MKKYNTLAALATLVTLASSSGATTLSYLDIARANIGSSNNLTTSGSTSTLAAGDSGTTSDIYRTLINFDLSAYATEIASATQITFSVRASQTLGVGADIYLTALDTDQASASFAQGTASGTTLAGFYASPSAGDTLTFDVTALVKADALAGDYSSFRIESQHSANDGNSNADMVRFGVIPNTDDATYPVTLTIIPEPGTSLLGLLGLGTALVRRKRA